MKLKTFMLIMTGIVIMVCSTIQIAQAQDTEFLSKYTQNIYTDESKIPVGQVKSIVQTTDGFLYFAGYQGLMRYNGINTKVFTPDDGFPTFNVNFLWEDQKKRLWIATNDAGLVLYDAGTFFVYGLNEGLPALSVRDIAEDAGGNIYAATGNGLVVLNEKGEAKVLLDGLVVHVEQLRQNEMVVLLGTGDIVRILDGSVVNTYKKGYFGDEQIISLYVTQAGNLYMGTFSNKIYITDAILYETRTLTLPHYINVNNFYESKNGLVWVVAENGIAYVEENQVIEVNGLAMDNSLASIYEDYEGNIWIGSSRVGLLQLTPSRFTNISITAGLHDYVINTTAVYNGDLYIGTDTGLIILRDNNIVENELSKMLSDTRIRSLFVDSKGDLWICTYERYGLLHLKQSGEIISITSGLPSDKLRCIIELTNGDMAIGGAGGVSIVRDDKIIKNYTSDDGISNPVILSLCEDDNGTLYAGSDGGGIYAIKGESIQIFDEKDGLLSGVILRMAIISGKMYISTGNALLVKEGEIIKDADVQLGYNNTVFDIKEVGHEIWLLCGKGIYIWNPETNNTTVLDRRDGLTAGITANSWNYIDNDGVLYISTNRQIFSTNVHNVAVNSVAPIAVIFDIKADEQIIITDGSTVRIPQNIKRLDINIALLSYFSEEGKLYYYLEGFDEEVKTATRQDLSRISYTNLKGGEYTFTVYGINAGGVKSEEISIKIVKQYTFFETMIGRLLVIVFLLTILSLGVRKILLYQKRNMLAQQNAYKDMTMQIMLSIAQALDSKNSYRKGYTEGVMKYANLMGKKLELDEAQLETLQYAAILHDIGIVGLPDELLSKNTPFTDEESKLMKTHTQIGCDILKSAEILKELSLVAHFHHEQPDGKGYYGLVNEEIPLFARIINVCSAYMAMSLDKTNKKALSKDKIRMEFMKNAGTQFDMNLAHVMLEIIEEEIDVAEHTD